MQTPAIKIHPQGPIFSRFVMGYWRLRQWNMSLDQLLAFIDHHLSLGITTVDHADIYGDYGEEAAFGKALQANPALRDKLQIVSKCGIQLISDARPQTHVKHYDTSKQHIIRSVEHSLSALHTDYLDLLLIHRPDPLMKADEVAEAFMALHQAGKVRHFGVSNFQPQQLELLQSRLPLPLVTNQVELSLKTPQCVVDGTLDHCQQHRMTPMAWSCLGGGDLFTKHDEQSNRIRWALGEISAELGDIPYEQLLYAWVLMHPSQPLPLLGTGRTDRVSLAVAAQEVKLSRQQWFKLLQAAQGHEVA